MRIGTKEFGVRLNNLSLSDSHTVIDRMGSWFIESDETVDFEIDIITAGQEKQITEEIFTIKVVVDLAEYYIQTITPETINNIIAIEQSIIESMVQEELITEEIETEEQIEQIEEILETEEIKQDDLIHQEEELKVDEITEIEEPVETVNETEKSEEIINTEENIKPAEEKIKEENKENVDIIEVKDIEGSSVEILETIYSEEVENIAPDEETENINNE